MYKIYVYRVVEIGTTDVTEKNLINGAVATIKGVVGTADPHEGTLVLPFDISELHQHISSKEEIGRALATLDDAMLHIRQLFGEVYQSALYSLQQRHDELAELLKNRDERLDGNIVLEKPNVED